MAASELINYIPENQPHGHHVYAVDGIHTWGSYYENITRRSLAGDLTAHAWITGEQAAAQMRKLGPPPDVLFIDSVSAEFAPKRHHQQYTKAFIWRRLPASPRAINGKDVIYVVMGDPTYGGMVKDTTWEDKQPVPLHKVLSDYQNTAEENAFARELHGLEQDQLHKTIKTAVSAEAATLALSASLVGAAYLEGLVVNRLRRQTGSDKIGFAKPKQQHVEKDLLSRRALLGAAAGIFGLAVLRPITEIESTISTNPKWLHFWRTIRDHTKYNFEQGWINGREAIGLAKADEIVRSNMLDLSENASAAVLMNIPHGDNAQRYINNRNARMKAESHYGEGLVRTVQSMLARKKPPTPPYLEQDIVGSLITYLTAMDIARVEDTGATTTDNPLTYFDQHITFYPTRLYSSEIIDSLRQFAPPEISRTL